MLSPDQSGVTGKTVHSIPFRNGNSGIATDLTRNSEYERTIVLKNCMLIRSMIR